MNNCIYLKTGNERFDKQEHIIPACIGGMKLLEKGMVSDKINEKFSKYEQEFAREYPEIILNRLNEGVSGRKKHGSKHKIALVTDKNTNEKALGYNEFANQRIDSHEVEYLPQFIFNYTKVYGGKHMDCNIRLPNVTLDREIAINELIENLKFFERNYKFIYETDIPYGKIFLAFSEGVWYIGINESFEETKAYDWLKTVTKSIIENKIKLCAQSNKMIHSHSDVSVKTKYKFHLTYIKIVYAKIAFNAFASIIGHNNILSSAFDDLRNAIINEDNIDCFVKKHNETDELFEKIIDNYSDKQHIILFKKESTGIYSNIHLFSSYSYFKIFISKSNSYLPNDLVYVCDYKNKKEYYQNVNVKD